MADYISREWLIERLGRNLAACNPGTFSEACYKDAIETVRYAPAADVEPVRRGRWVDFTNAACMCPVCGAILAAHSYYCPNCGAKMDGGAEDG